MNISEGAGSRISVTYAEALKDENGIKGHRDQIDGKSISGIEDRFHISQVQARVLISPSKRPPGSSGTLGKTVSTGSMG
jgi:hypothetical protein